MRRFRNIRYHPIPGAPGYFVSRSGKVFSEKTKRTLSIHLNVKGYLRVTFWLDGRRARFFVHRLVAITFIPNPEKKPEVNHMDFNIHNNARKNLEWVTKSENAIHAKKYKCFGADRPRGTYEEERLRAGTPF